MKVILYGYLSNYNIHFMRYLYMYGIVYIRIHDSILRDKILQLLFLFGLL